MTFEAAKPGDGETTQEEAPFLVLVLDQRVRDRRETPESRVR